MKELTDFQNFNSLDIRVGTIISAESLANARKPAYVLHIDFGSKIGVLKSSAQITDLYTTSELTDRQIVAVINFPAKQIAGVQSQCLVLGTETESGVVLLQLEREIENGSAIS